MARALAKIKRNSRGAALAERLAKALNLPFVRQWHGAGDGNRQLASTAAVEKSLRQSEAYLAETQRLTHTGSWAFDPATGKVNYWSDEMFRIFGIEPRNGAPCRDEQVRLTHPEDRVRNSEAIQAAIRGKSGFVLDYRKVMTDGTVRYLHSIGHPVLDMTGALIEYVGTAVDVTERRRADDLRNHRHVP